MDIKTKQIHTDIGKKLSNIDHKYGRTTGNEMNETNLVQSDSIKVRNNLICVV